jgi:hypothetical protein
MVLSAAQKTDIQNKINKYIPDEAMANQDYMKLADEFDRYANDAQKPAVSPYRVGYPYTTIAGDTAGASYLRNWAAILRGMAYDEGRHKSNLEMMKNGANNLKTVL